MNDISREIFENSCAAMATVEELTTALGCTKKALMAWCQAEYGRSLNQVMARLQAQSLLMLRHAMFQAAIIDGNSAMMSLLAKEYLEMGKKKKQAAAQTPIKESKAKEADPPAVEKAPDPMAAINQIIGLRAVK